MKSYSRGVLVIDANVLHQLLEDAATVTGVQVKVSTVQKPISECKLIQSFATQPYPTMLPRLAMVYEHAAFPFTDEDKALPEATLVITVQE